MSAPSANLVALGVLAILAVAFALSLLWRAGWLLATPVRTFSPGAVAAVAAATCAACFLLDGGVVRCSGNQVQVPQSWHRRFGPPKAFTYYGVMLGAGVLTFVPYAATYAVFATASLVPSLSVALVGGALYGCGRTILSGVATLLPDAVLGRLGVDVLPRVYRVGPGISGALCLTLAGSSAAAS